MLDIRPSETPLEPKLWRLHLDNYMQTGQFNPDLLPHLDATQMLVINEIKKSFARISSKEKGFIPETKYTNENNKH